MTDIEAIEIIKDMFEDFRVNISTELTGSRKEAVDTILLAYAIVCKELDKKNRLLKNIRDELVGDRMEQFDDYVIYLQDKYLKILGESEE